MHIYIYSWNIDLSYSLYSFTARATNSSIQGANINKKNMGSLKIVWNCGKDFTQHVCHSALFFPQFSTLLLTPHSSCSNSAEEYLLATLQTSYLFLLISIMAQVGLIKEHSIPTGFF